VSALLADFHFLRPWWLGLFAPLAYYCWNLWRHQPGQGFWQRICDPALIPFVVTDGDGKIRRRSLLPFALGGSCAILALAGPTYERTPQPVFRDQAALVLLLDLSSSMSAPDITPSRLERAQFKIKDLLATRATGQTALVVFAAQPFTVTPLTDDVKTIDSQLAILTPELMPSQGGDIPRAMQQGVELLKQAGFSRGDLLLITDSIAPDAIEPTVSKLGGGQFRLSVLGVGTTIGSPIPLPDGGFVTARNGAIVLSKLTVATLTQLAQRGGGIFQTAGSSNTRLISVPVNGGKLVLGYYCR
jgi:Ca-activated chloride channel homolog